MKTKLIKRLNEIMLEIVKANDKELDGISSLISMIKGLFSKDRSL